MKCFLNSVIYLFYHGMTMKLSAVFLKLTTGWQQCLLEAGVFVPQYLLLLFFPHLKNNHIKFVNDV